MKTIPEKLNVLKKAAFNKDVRNKERILKKLPKMFKVITCKKLRTNYEYPNRKIAFRIIKNGLKLWFDINLNKKEENSLIKLIAKHQRRKRIMFNEKLYFYILKRKY